MDNLIDKAKEKGEQLKEQVTDKVKEGLEKAKDTAQEAGKTMKETTKDAIEQAKDATNKQGRPAFNRSCCNSR
jgi:ElaB/YqjD/DUF883 family membrane-anchored ribosome-binding protein